MLLLNDGYSYESIGGNNDNAPGGDLPLWHSGYRGEGLSVLTKPEFTAEKIKENNPDAVLLMLGINSIGSKKEYPDTQGQYWSNNGNNFNAFFTSYKAFIDKVLANSNKAKVFIAKIPPISDTRFYQTSWDDNAAPSPTGWTTLGDGSVNPKNVVSEFNTELQALYDKYYTNNPRVIVVDLNTDFTVGDKWEDDVNIIGVPQNWWNGDGLHPTHYGYRHIAERWNTAIRAAFPTQWKLLYSVDCGTKEGTKSLAAEGAIVGNAQSVVWDKPYGPDATTGKNWGHVGDADYNGLSPKPTSPAIYFAWEGAANVYESIATSTTGNNLVYRFEVPVGGTYRVHLGFYDTWGENANPKGTTRQAKVYIDGALKDTKTYQLKDFGRSIYETTNTTGTLEVKLEGVAGDALLDSIVIQRLH
jgi:lysophospholipase L1-like esterase